MIRASTIEEIRDITPMPKNAFGTIIRRIEKRVDRPDSKYYLSRRKLPPPVASQTEKEKNAYLRNKKEDAKLYKEIDQINSEANLSIGYMNRWERVMRVKSAGIQERARKLNLDEPCEEVKPRPKTAISSTLYRASTFPEPEPTPIQTVHEANKVRIFTPKYYDIFYKPTENNETPEIVRDDQFSYTDSEHCFSDLSFDNNSEEDIKSIPTWSRKGTPHYQKKFMVPPPNALTRKPSWDKRKSYFDSSHAEKDLKKQIQQERKLRKKQSDLSVIKTQRIQIALDQQRLRTKMCDEKVKKFCKKFPK